MKTLYDGFTFEIIKESPILANGLFTDKYNTGIQYSSSDNGKQASGRYRYVDDSRQDGRYSNIDDDVYENTAARNTRSRAVLYGNGSPVAINRGNDTAYLGTDILGSVRTVIADNAEVENSYDYDVFGTPITGNFGSGVDFGYLGKLYDTATGLYNYGYRDYSPTTARFTTVDPIRDGTNWFVYVNGDPVNWVDLWGLELVNLQFVDMHNSLWGDENLGNSNSVKVNKQGCYASGFSSVASALLNKSITPLTLNSQKSTNFAKESQSMLPKNASDNLNLEYDYWTKANQGNLSTKINEINNSKTEYGVLAQVPYNGDGDLHRVGITGDVVDGYVKAVGTSKFDYTDYNRPKTWEIKENSIKIPVADIVKIHTFTKKKNK